MKKHRKHHGLSILRRFLEVCWGESKRMGWTPLGFEETLPEWKIEQTEINGL